MSVSSVTMKRFLNIVSSTSPSSCEMFKLFPSIIILLMISRKVSYLNEEEEEVMISSPTEFAKTNMFSQTPVIFKRGTVKQRGVVVDLTKEVNRDILKRYLSSEMGFFLHFEAEDDESMKEFFQN